jgi:hypothetical protein
MVNDPGVVVWRNDALVLVMLVRRYACGGMLLWDVGVAIMTAFQSVMPPILYGKRT